MSTFTSSDLQRIADNSHYINARRRDLKVIASLINLGIRHDFKRSQKSVDILAKIALPNFPGYIVVVAAKYKHPRSFSIRYPDSDAIYFEWFDHFDGLKPNAEVPARFVLPLWQCLPELIEALLPQSPGITEEIDFWRAQK